MIALLLLFVAVESTSWYAAHDLGQKQSDYLIEKQCFRGSYRGDISLLTCDVEGAQLISNLPDHTPLCVLELARHGNKERASEIATSSGELSVIFSSRQSLVLAAKSDLIRDFPAPCLPHFDYEGLVDNVITVPSSPVRAEVFVPTPRLAPNPDIAKLLNNVSSVTFRERLTWLQNTYWTRHSQSTNGTSNSTNLPGAIADIQNFYRQYAGWNVSTQSLNRAGYNNPNILAVRTGTRYTNQYVVFGAHLDDRMSSLNDATSRAPGADDNGSGSIAVLELARLISQFGYRFEYNLAFAHFTGEEQGLYGSQRMAEVFRAMFAEQGVDATNTVIAMYNVDMLAFNQSTTASILGLTNSSGRISVPLLTECINVFREYFPNLQYGQSTACCSDQQSFQSQGFPSMSFFETPTSSVVYGQYHQSGDLINATGYSVEQVTNFAKAAYSCVLTKALIVPP